MTLLVAWLAVDTKGPSSIYLASDSRISWGNSTSYDLGRKVFACKASADLFGYCGDVLFPSMVLSQIVEMADAGILFDPDTSPKERSKRVTQKLRYMFSRYPSDVAGITAKSLEIVHASRDWDGKQFRCSTVRWIRSKGWCISETETPTNSGLLFVLGSGAKDFNQRFQKYSNGPNAKTSRSVFQCFCDSVANSGVGTVGGAPQLVGIMRKSRSTGMNFGIISSGRRYLLGSQVNELTNFDRIGWKNDLFEICDGKTGKRKIGARSRPNPHIHG